MNGWRVWGIGCLVAATALVFNGGPVWAVWVLAYWGGVGVANDNREGPKLRRERDRREWSGE